MPYASALVFGEEREAAAAVVTRVKDPSLTYSTK